MGNFGGFFKGEKKKAKKGQNQSRPIGTAPVFIPPKLISKGKKPEGQ